MRYAEELGFRAGKRNVPITRCPYVENATLRERWLAGHAKGYAMRPSYPRRRGRRTRWPKSEYARQRLMEALKV